MTLSQQSYTAAGAILPFGVGAAFFAILFYRLYWRPRTFYRMIKAMFSIEHYRAILPTDREFIDIYGVQIELSATIFGFLPRLALLIMTTAVLTATFVFFLSELLLITRYVSPNSKCPLDDDMDCFTTMNGTYLFCNSTDTRIDASLGSLVCYRWIKGNVGTVDILNQTGLCGGLLEAFRWFVKKFLRWLLHASQKTKRGLHGRKMPQMKVVDYSLRKRHSNKLCLKFILVTLITLSPCVVLIILSTKNISRTGLTVLVLSAIFLVSVSGLLLLIAHESTDFKHGVSNETNPSSPMASETAIHPVSSAIIHRF